MCGRFDQSQTARYYAQVFGWTDAVYDSEPPPAWNVSPGSYRPVMHLQDGERRIDDVFWSYRARWAEGKLPVMVNARMDKLTNRYWKPLLKKGRAIVPAEGWYEWTGEKGKKQPWHIHRKDRAPLFLLALANFGSLSEERAEHRAEAGFVLVTDAADAGMLDIHDRRPVVLAAEDAELWLSPELSPEEALDLARRAALPSDAFEWYQVSTAVNRAGAQDPQMALPLAEQT